MNRKFLTLLLTAAIALVFAVTCLYAGTEVADNITLDYNKYEKRMFKLPKHNFVNFTHKKHNTDYKISCDECHHIELKMGDHVKPCADCHIELKPTEKNRKSIMLLRNAYHASCRDCHREFNKEAGDPRGFKKDAPPTSCSECHIKNSVEQQ